MATTEISMAPSSLPSKKRALSGASSNNNSESNANETSSRRKNSDDRAPIADNRLPSKKRKGSHDSSAAAAAAVAAVAPPPRKGSHDSTVSMLSTKSASGGAGASASSSAAAAAAALALPSSLTRQRKGSIDSFVLIDHLQPSTVPAPRKLSSASADDTAGGGADGVVSTSALEHLDALAGAEGANATTQQQPRSRSNSKGVNSKDGVSKGTSGAAAEKNHEDAEGDGDDGSATTFASSGQRLLFEAMMGGGGSISRAGGGGRDRLESWGALRSHHSSNPEQHQQQQGSEQANMSRFQLESWGGVSQRGGAGRDRLESWGAMSDLSVPLAGPLPAAAAAATSTTQNQSSAAALVAAAAATAAAVAKTSGDESKDDEPEEEDSKPQAIPSRIRLDSATSRIRLDSVASLSELSLSNLAGLMGDGSNHAGSGAAGAGVTDAVVSSDIQAYVAAAMATVGDQLSDLAGVVEDVALAADTETLETIRKEMGLFDTTTGGTGGAGGGGSGAGDNDDDASSTGLFPIIGAASDSGRAAGAATARRGRSSSLGRRPRSWSTSSGRISVDYEAVQAAVDAAEAATGTLDLSSIGRSSTTTAHPLPPPAAVTTSSSNAGAVGRSAGTSTTAGGTTGTLKRRRPLPTMRGRLNSSGGSSLENDPYYGSTASGTAAAARAGGGSGMISEEERARIRERARAAAGYIPPSVPGDATDEENDDGSPSPKRKRLPPIKKRLKRPPSAASGNAQSSKNRGAGSVGGSSGVAAPKQATSKGRKGNDNGRKSAAAPDMVSSSDKAPPPAAAKPVRGQASQKWESMFDCLVEFAEQRRAEETAKLSEEEKKEWVWDGNVPTNYKTKSGKALGRWVNNQRSAKSKGTLKEEREQRLVDAGLKWSVLASNSWNEMLGELRIYVKEQTKNGQQWDGNVPTSYQIKTRPGGSRFAAGEDKNLGRWVNRQRSLYQSGKLRKDRQKDLEEVGLKWSMLATMSWDCMYDTLKAYVEKQKKENGEWDGNVPANYRTGDTPPRALGRWINRQRSAYMKKKLKQEYVDKLNAIGLKWSVHQRQVDPSDEAPAPAAVPDKVGSENAAAAAAAASSKVGATGSAGSSDKVTPEVIVSKV